MTTFQTFEEAYETANKEQENDFGTVYVPCPDGEGNFIVTVWEQLRCVDVL